MRLSTKARYGLRALCHIAHHGYASAQTISEREGIPGRYLEEIIGELRRAGLVQGKRGPRGGYRLGRPSGEITLLEILDALTNLGPAAEEPADPTSAAVERLVDQRLEASVRQIHLASLLTEAREQQLRAAANYVI